MKTNFIILLIALSLKVCVSQNDAYSIFLESFKIIEKAQSMQYTNITKEKIDGEYLEDECLIKVIRKPYKTYLFQHKEGGSEILYNTEIDKEKALVNPDRFPYITLSLSPAGSLMRHKTHHTIFQADIKYTYDILKFYLNKENKNISFNLIGKVKVNKKVLYKLELINKDYRIFEYKVKPDEDLADIAKKKYLGAYRILELNPEISFYDDVVAGDLIQIPSYYSNRISIYIDPINYLPYMIKVFDDSGLYESYTFKNLVLNVNFKPNEFLKDFEEYNF